MLPFKSVVGFKLTTRFGRNARLTTQRSSAKARVGLATWAVGTISRFYRSLRPMATILKRFDSYVYTSYTRTMLWQGHCEFDRLSLILPSFALSAHPFLILSGMNQGLRCRQGTRTLRDKGLFCDVGDRHDGPSEWKLIMTVTGSPGHDDRVSTHWSAR